MKMNFKAITLGKEEKLMDFMKKLDVPVAL